MDAYNQTAYMHTAWMRITRQRICIPHGFLLVLADSMLSGWGAALLRPQPVDLKKFENIVRVSEGVGGPQCGIFTTQAIRHTVHIYMPLKRATRPHGGPKPKHYLYP